MRGIPWRLLGAGALTALLLDLPFPLAGPLPAWRAIFAWYALVPLLVALLRLPLEPGSKPLRWSFLAGWWTGALWFGANCYWVYNTMHLYGNMNKAMAVVCLVLFSLYLGFWFGVFALALALIRQATIRRATARGKFAWVAFAAIPFLWTAMEFAIARIPEFPWDQLGYSQVDNGLLTRLAPWTGVYGISFVVAGINALLTAGWMSVKVDVTSRRLDPAIYWYGLQLACWILFVLSAGWLFAPPKPPSAATAVLIQPNLNVATDDAWSGTEWDRHMAQFGQLAGGSCSREYIAGMPETGAPRGEVECGPNPAPPALIVWPESPAPFRDADPRFRSSVAEIVRQHKAPMIVGNVGMDLSDADRKVHVYNSASIVSSDGEFAGRYDKIHLVPFGEYIPFRKLLFFAHQLTDQLSDMGDGANRHSFAIASANGQAHRYGIFICYESVFADEVRQFAKNGAEVLVNISDDGWYGDSSAPWQHLNMARMRAIENRRWILRDTNNGVTAVIDPYGTVRQSIPRHQVDTLPAEFGYGSEITFYTVHGDWLAELCAILSLVLVIWSSRAILGGKASQIPAKAK